MSDELPIFKQDALTARLARAQRQLEAARVANEAAHVALSECAAFLAAGGVHATEGVLRGLFFQFARKAPVELSLREWFALKLGGAPVAKTAPAKVLAASLARPDADEPPPGDRDAAEGFDEGYAPSPMARRILLFIRENGSASQSDLTKHFRHRMVASVIREELEVLLARGEIVAFERPGDGRFARVYRVADPTEEPADQGAQGAPNP